jgi:hypothetical protein
MRSTVRAHDKTKKNPLKNKAIMNRLNPFAAEQAQIIAKQQADRQSKRAAAVAAKRSKVGKAGKQARSATYHGLQDQLKASFRAAEDVLAEEEKAGNYMPGDTSEDDE